MAGIANRMSVRRLPYAHLIATEDKPVPSAGSDVQFILTRRRVSESHVQFASGRPVQQSFRPCHRHL